MQFSQKAIYAYCEAHTSPLDGVLYELERETHLKTVSPQMMSGHLQGAFLRMLSELVQPKVAVEIGTFTGYGAICLAQGLAPDGVLHTIEANPELESIIRKFLEKAGLQDRVNLHIGQAEQVISTLPGDFDLVFLDAGKQDYSRHYDLVIDRVRPGGLILADNVLWAGKVVDPNPDADTRILLEFNRKVRQDPRVETLMLPLRDGLLIVRKGGVGNRE